MYTTSQNLAQNTYSVLSFVFFPLPVIGHSVLQISLTCWSLVLEQPLSSVDSSLLLVPLFGMFFLTLLALHSCLVLSLLHSPFSKPTSSLWISHTESASERLALQEA